MMKLLNNNGPYMFIYLTKGPKIDKIQTGLVRSDKAASLLKTNLIWKLSLINLFEFTEAALF